MVCVRTWSPEGLTAHLSGLFIALQNDNSVLAELRLLDYMERHAWKEGEREGEKEGNHIYYHIYVDLAYGVS